VHQYAASIVLGTWLAFAPVMLAKLPGLFGRTSRRGLSSVIGVIIVAVAFALVWRGASRRTPTLAIAPRAGAVIAVMSAALGLWAIVTLGRQWSIQATLRTDHALITTGPYGWVRHPVYLAFLGMLVGTGLVFASGGWQVIVGILLYLVGTEFRVHAEDELLRQRFGQAFDDYARRIPALFPFPSPKS
jgi:protein-S-isoprenylcysteine O-methyltransferase Ste14